MQVVLRGMIVSVKLEHSVCLNIHKDLQSFIMFNANSMLFGPINTCITYSGMDTFFLISWDDFVHFCITEQQSSKAKCTLIVALQKWIWKKGYCKEARVNMWHLYMRAACNQWHHELCGCLLLPEAAVQKERYHYSQSLQSVMGLVRWLSEIHSTHTISKFDVFINLSIYCCCKTKKTSPTFAFEMLWFRKAGSQSNQVTHKYLNFAQCLIRINV